eukprot:g2474.t1
MKGLSKKDIERRILTKEKGFASTSWSKPQLLLKARRLGLISDVEFNASVPYSYQTYKCYLWTLVKDTTIREKLEEYVQCRSKLYTRAFFILNLCTHDMTGIDPARPQDYIPSNVFWSARKEQEAPRVSSIIYEKLFGNESKTNMFLNQCYLPELYPTRCTQLDEQSVIRCAKEYVKVLQEGIDQKELFKLLNQPWPSQLPIGIKDEVVKAIKEVRRVIGMEDDSYLPKYANCVTVDLLDLHLYFSRIDILKRPLMPVAPLNRKYATIDDKIAKFMFNIKKEHLNDKDHDHPYLHFLGFSPQTFEDAQNSKRKMLRKHQGPNSKKIRKKWKAKGRINLPKNGVIRSIFTDGVGLSLRLASPLKMEYIHEPVDKNIKRKKDKTDQTKLVEKSRHEDGSRRPVFVGIDTGRCKLYCGSISKGGEAKPEVIVYTGKKYYYDIRHGRMKMEEQENLQENVLLRLTREALGVAGQDNNILSFIQVQNLYHQVLIEEHINSKFYSFRKMRAFRLKKAALSKASNALIDSAIEPNRRLVLGIGNANFSSSGRGSKSAPTTSLMKAIQEAKRTKKLELNKGTNWSPIIILNINEFRTTLICSTCGNPTSQPLVRKPNGEMRRSSRLHVNGRFLGFRRNRVAQKCNFALLQIDGVVSRSEVEWYIGKRVCFPYKARTERNGTRHRAIWGKVISAHGNSGTVRARFKKNLPSAAMGRPVRIMLYPQKG